MCFPNASMRFCPQDIAPYFPKQKETHFQRSGSEERNPQNQGGILRAIELRTAGHASDRFAISHKGNYCTFSEYVRREMKELQLLSDNDSVDCGVMPKSALHILQILQQQRSGFTHALQFHVVQLYIDYLKYRDPHANVEQWIQNRDVDPQCLSDGLRRAIELLEKKLSPEVAAIGNASKAA